jgi:hypothetical protein
MKNYSISDKIAVVLAWVLIQTVIGIAAIKAIYLCDNWTAVLSVGIVEFAACYFWSQKMIDEVKKVFSS